MSSGKTLLGVLAGVAIGAILGILFAPEKGSETRKKISKKGDDYTDALQYKFYEFMDSIKQKTEEAKEEGKDFVEKGKDIVEKGKAKFDDVKKDVKNAAADFKHEGADIKHSIS